jgi:hypothetical protein
VAIQKSLLSQPPGLLRSARNDEQRGFSVGNLTPTWAVCVRRVVVAAPYILLGFLSRYGWFAYGERDLLLFLIPNS